MGRVITERLVSVGWGIRPERVQEVGADGQPLFDGNGLPKMVDRTVLLFESLEGTVRYVVEVPLDNDAKADMLRALSGGVIIASSVNGAEPAGG